MHNSVSQISEETAQNRSRVLELRIDRGTSRHQVRQDMPIHEGEKAFETELRHVVSSIPYFRESFSIRAVLGNLPLDEFEASSSCSSCLFRTSSHLARFFQRERVISLLFVSSSGILLIAEMAEVWSGFKAHS